MDTANAVFDDIDADKSGEIDPAELMMHLLGVGQEHESVSALFAVLDTDGNGSISREEFVAGFEQLQTFDKLAVLRRLTPEQEAAAAKAAQRIGEVAAAAEAAPEEERAAVTIGDGDVIWDYLGGGVIESLIDHTPLIDLEYLVALAEGSGRRRTR